MRIPQSIATMLVLVSIAAAPVCAQDQAPTPPPSGQKDKPGDYVPGKGIVLAKGSTGEIDVGLWTYVRYLNQLALNSTYTDAFGRTFSIKRRQDIQDQKVNLKLDGWFASPRLRYSLFVWTANTSQGDPAETVVGTVLAFTVNTRLILAAGAGALPSTRSTQNTFPYWIRVDHRSIADEFFRASYTTGVWGEGRLGRAKYRVMIGNNLSGFGVDASQLDNHLNTVSGAVWWMPTTGEYGPNEGYGDFEEHQKPATILGLHYTRSGEDAQSQPGTEAIENVQIRLSDGTNIFDANSFFPNFRVTHATYQMFSPDAGIKYRGLSLDGEYYFRWINQFQTVGVAPVSSLFDDGFDLATSGMVLPKTLQVYGGVSKIRGQYGRPWDATAGVNVFPVRTHNFRFNAQAMYVRRSPVGYSAVPYPIGGTGMIYTMDAELVFF